LRDPLCESFNETTVNVIVELYDKAGITSTDLPSQVVQIIGNFTNADGDIVNTQLGENKVLCENVLTVGYKRFNNCYRLLESYHDFTQLENPSIPSQLIPEAPGQESVEREYEFPYFVSNETEDQYGEVVFKFERVPIKVSIVVNVVNTSTHHKLPVSVIENNRNLSITTFNGNAINEINDLRCGLEYTIEFERLHCYEFIESRNDLELSIPIDLGLFVFFAPTRNGIIEFDYRLKEIETTIIFNFADAIPGKFTTCGTQPQITNIKDIVLITGYITNVMDEQES
jgi:hypothetical protein